MTSTCDTHTLSIVDRADDWGTSLPRLESPQNESALTLSPEGHEAQLEKWRELYRDTREEPFDGTVLRTDPDVFPAQEGDTSRDIALAIRELEHFHERKGDQVTGKIALDMGCGNGALGITIAALSSYSQVIAVDNHEPAIKNAQANFETCSAREKFSAYRSDLMRDVPREVVVDGEKLPLRLDLVVFNHPYYPREQSPEFGLGAEGGKELIERFFAEITPFIHNETEIIMPFSTDVDAQHDPAAIAQSLGFSVSILRERIDSNGIRHKVYRFCRSERLADKLPTTIVREAVPTEYTLLPSLAA